MSEPGQNLSDKQLKYSYWYLLHKKELRKIGLIILIVFDVLMVGWTVLGLVKYLDNYSEFSSSAPNYIDWQSYHKENQPVDLQISSPRAVKSTSGFIDIGVLVRNPNAEWAIQRFVYQFVLAGGQTTPIEETFFLPNEEKYLLALGVSTIGTTASLQVLDLDWRRIPKGEIITSEVMISNEEFVPAARLDGQDLGGQVNWHVENKSARGYYDPGFIVVLFSGSREVAFNYMRLNSIDSLSVRELTVSWGHKLPTITGVQVRSNINIFDSDVIK